MHLSEASSFTWPPPSVRWADHLGCRVLARICFIPRAVQVPEQQVESGARQLPRYTAIKQRDTHLKPIDEALKNSWTEVSIGTHDVTERS